MNNGNNKFRSDRFTLINKLLKISSRLNSKGYLWEPLKTPVEHLERQIYL